MLRISVVVLALAVAGLSTSFASAQKVRDRSSDLRDNPEIVSPLILRAPIYACAETVVVAGYVPGALIRVYRAGNPTPIGEKTAIQPYQQTVKVAAPFVASEDIFAVQVVDGVPSDPSNTVRTTDHQVDFPNGLPQPRLFGIPPLMCGRAIGINDVPPGARAVVIAQNPIPGGGFESPMEVGSLVDFPYTHISPAFKDGARVWAQSELCTSTSLRSLEETVMVGPDDLKAPTVDELPEGSNISVVRGLPGIGLENGATLDVLEDLGGSFRRAGGQATAYDAQQVYIAPAAAGGETYRATQALCEKSDPGDPTDVLPCSRQQPPVPRPIAPGDDRVEFIDFYPGARIKIFANGVKIGDGGGAVVQLTRSINAGERIDILQEFPPDCQAGLVVTLEADCPDGGIPGVCAGDWPAFRQNGRRDGAQRIRSSVSDPALVRNLDKVWTFRLSADAPNDTAPRGFVASPIVYDGLVYIGSSGGHFYALDAASGNIQWVYPPRGEPALVSQFTCNSSSFGVASAALIARVKNEVDAVIFGAPDPGRPADPGGKLGAGLGSGRLFALNAKTGNLIWKSPEIAVLNGTNSGNTSQRHEQIGYAAPLLVGDRIYIGVGDHCDNPIQNGRIVAVDRDNGAIDPNFSFLATNRRGGGVWSSLSGRSDGDLFATTGNTNDRRQTKPSVNHGLSLLRLDRSSGAVDWKLQPVPFEEDGDPDWASGVVLLDAACGRRALSTMKDGFSYGMLETLPFALRWQFPLSRPNFTSNPEFPVGDLIPHGDTRYHRAGAGWHDTFITTTGGEQVLDEIDQNDVIENYTAIHGLNVCALDSGRVDWIYRVPGTPATFSRSSTQLSPPSVAHGVIYVGTNNGRLVALADPRVWPGQSAACSHTDFLSQAACVAAGFQLVGSPTTLYNTNLGEGSILSEPVPAGGAVYVATRGGALVKLEPK